MSNLNEPYKAFRFKVKWDGQYITGVSKVNGLIRTTDVIQHREGGDVSATHKFPGRTQFAPIILERGLTQDTAFEAWANEVLQIGSGAGLTTFRKQVTIDFFNEADQKVASYNVFRCWPSEYQAFSELNADGDAIASERIRLENDGWARDPNVAPPP